MTPLNVALALGFAMAGIGGILLGANIAPRPEPCAGDAGLRSPSCAAVVPCIDAVYFPQPGDVLMCRPDQDPVLGSAGSAQAMICHCKSGEPLRMIKDGGS